MKTLYIERSTGECRNGAWVGELDLEPQPGRIVVGMGPGSFAGIRSALAFAQGYALGSGCEVLGLPSPCAVIGALVERALPTVGADHRAARDPVGADHRAARDPVGADHRAARDTVGADHRAARDAVGADHRAAREITVVGDARQGKIWLAQFDGWKMLGAVRQVDAADLAAAVSPTATVVTPDGARLGARLAELFGARYRGEALPTAAGLRAYAEHVPEALVREPLPIYLNPAVRPIGK